jgi:hypothetical protein
MANRQIKGCFYQELVDSVGVHQLKMKGKFQVELKLKGNFQVQLKMKIISSSN